jgi:hypothetical protein
VILKCGKEMLTGEHADDINDRINAHLRGLRPPIRARRTEPRDT